MIVSLNYKYKWVFVSAAVLGLFYSMLNNYYDLSVDFQKKDNIVIVSVFAVLIFIFQYLFLYH